MKLQATQGTALITGASSGIGAVYADRLARRGYDLILVARNSARLEELAARIETETDAMVGTLAADLTNPADLRRVEQAFGLDTSISVLVNNAGIGLSTPTHDTDVNALQAMIETNITALTRLSYAAAAAFVERGRGAIINISSVAAIAPEILNSVYGGTKAFVLAFSQALRQELRDTGVRVQVVLPGAVATEFWSHSGTPLEQLPRDIVMSVDDVVDAALAGFDLGEAVTIPSLPDVEAWNSFDAARLALRPNLSRSQPAARYAASPRVYP